jgi:hypothetical protein
MTESAAEVLARARARETERHGIDSASLRIDYDAAKKLFRKQKARLTRAVNSGDRDKILLACTQTVREWNADYPCAGVWPDDGGWREQAALDAAFPPGEAPQLHDLD